MTTYQHTPDGEDEPCLWYYRDKAPHWQPLLRRVDLPPDARGLWADVVAGVLSVSDGWVLANDNDDPAGEPG